MPIGVKESKAGEKERGRGVQGKRGVDFIDVACAKAIDSAHNSKDFIANRIHLEFKAEKRRKGPDPWWNIYRKLTKDRSTNKRLKNLGGFTAHYNRM